MINYFEAIILGIIQGITEFLPISSSGHLIIGRTFFEIDSSGTGSFIEVFLHGGTLLSILFFWKKDLIDSFKTIAKGHFKLLYSIIIATIPAAIIGLFFKNKINNYFFDINNTMYLPFSYLILSVVLFLTKYKFKNHDSYNKVIYQFAFIIGLAQCFAIIPGISRSGMTISIAILLGINKKIATKFSFLLAIPILTFSFFDSIKENFGLLNDASNSLSLFFGFISSFLTGYFVIAVLVKMIEQKRLWYFSIYCFLLSIILGYYNGV